MPEARERDRMRRRDDGDSLVIEFGRKEGGVELWDEELTEAHGEDRGRLLVHVLLRIEDNTERR